MMTQSAPKCYRVIRGLADISWYLCNRVHLCLKRCDKYRLRIGPTDLADLKT